jgi:hypothetical protein
MAQRLLHRIEEPLHDLVQLSTRPLLDLSLLPPPAAQLLPPAAQQAAGALLTPMALALLLLLGLAVATAAAAHGAVNRRGRRWAADAPEGAAAAGMVLVAGPPPPSPSQHDDQQQQQQQWGAPLRAPAVLGLVASAAVLLRVAWAPLYSSLELLPAAQLQLAPVAAAAATYSSLSAALTWGSTAIAIGSVARLLLTAAPRAAAAEAVGAVVIAATLHRALLLADTVVGLFVDQPAAAKVRAGLSFLLYGLVTEVRWAGAEGAR